MSFSIFVLQLEDDVVAKDGYYSDMKMYTTREASKDWLFLEFSQLGFIGVFGVLRVSFCLGVFALKSVFF